MRISLVMVAGGAGGLQQSIIPYAAALRHFGHDVQVIMNYHSPLRGDVEAHGFMPDVVYGLMQYSMTSFFGVRRHLSKFAPHAVIGFASKGYPVARQASQNGVPVLTRLGSMKPERIKKLLGADGLLVTTEEMRSLAVKLGANSSRVRIVPNFLTAGLGDRSAKKRNVVRIGAMGRLFHRKGFDILLRAAQLLQNEGLKFELVIAGAGKEESYLRALAESLSVSVEWIGWVENSQKSQFFDNLDIFVCPSRDEPFGQVFLEAMRAAVPIVASNTVGARAIFKFGHDCYACRQEDPEDMARQISILLQNEKLREKIGKAGADCFLKTFHLEEAGRKLCDAISALIKDQSLGQSQ